MFSLTAIDGHASTSWVVLREPHVCSSLWLHSCIFVARHCCAMSLYTDQVYLKKAPETEGTWHNIERFCVIVLTAYKIYYYHLIMALATKHVNVQVIVLNQFGNLW